ncbi:MAG: hypothetical protein OXH22_09365 [Chloroflexi bacterium]|nr:hypothetical protein [Chloroflexota bacterium]
MRYDPNQQPRRESNTSFIVGIIIIVVILVIVGNAIRGDDEVEVIQTSATNAPTVDKVATVRAQAEEKRKGFHCLSWWDGNHDAFERLVKQRLNDPSSMETFETRVTPVKDGKHEIIMEFGAKNAFGGMVRSFAFGTYDHQTCEPTLTRIE